MSPKTLRRRAAQCRKFELEVEAQAMDEAADEIERLWDALMEIRTMQGNPIEIARKATDNKGEIVGFSRAANNVNAS